MSKPIRIQKKVKGIEIGILFGVSLVIKTDDPARAKLAGDWLEDMNRRATLYDAAEAKARLDAVWSKVKLMLT